MTDPHRDMAVSPLRVLHAEFACLKGPCLRQEPRWDECATNLPTVCKS